MIKVAINGFGRIGRLAFRKMFEDDNYEITAINDLADPGMLAHLLKYDSVQGRYSDDHKIANDDSSITVDGTKINIFSEPDPKNLPWGELQLSGSSPLCRNSGQAPVRKQACIRC